MKIILFGLGSIGQKYARLLHKNLNCQLYAYRTKKGQKSVAAEFKSLVCPLDSWKDIEKVHPDIAFITNPTHLHIKTAIQCAQRGMHLFIEKPLDCKITDLNDLKKIVAQKRLTTYVAYCLRFHPIILQLKKECQKRRLLHMRVVVSSYLPGWRPEINHRKSYSANSSMGGGVIFDLSHELDYIEYLLGEIRQMSGRFGKCSDVTVDAEDYADILLTTSQGPVNVHLNFLSLYEQRMIYADFQDRSIVADLLNDTITEYRLRQSPKKVRHQSGGQEGCLNRQLKYFLANRRNPEMMNNIFDAGRLLKKLCHFKNLN